MQKICTILLLLVAVFTSQAQELYIYDVEEKQALERVVVRVFTDNLAPLYTNDRGLVDISAFKGAEEIEISSLGYQTIILSYSNLKQLKFRLGLQSQALALDQVVISATRWNQSSRELPYNISTLKTKDVIFNNPQTTADLLGSSGEVFIQKSQQGGGSPMIRGFATNRLLIAVDGIRMNNAIFRSGNLQQVISLDPFAVERTEIYFGPGSVIYGSDAIGGVMSFSTLSPDLTSSDKLLVKGSSYSRFSSANQEITQHFDLNIGGQKWAYRGSASYFRYGDLQMGSYGSDQLLRPWYVEKGSGLQVRNPDPQVQKHTGFDQFATMHKLLFKPNSHWDFEYALHYSATSNYDRYDRLIRTRNGLPRSAEWYYGPQVWLMNKLEVNHRQVTPFSDRITLRLAQQRFEESRNDRDWNDPILQQREERVMAYSLNLDLLKRISKDHKIFYGVEAVYNDVNSEGRGVNILNSNSFDIADRYPQATWESYAAYINHEWEWSEKFTSQLGLRYNHFSINTDFRANQAFYPLPFEESELNTGNTTGSLGFVYRPSESWKWRMNFGTAFRAPNVDDLGKVFDSGDQIVVVPNPDLEAEYAYNTELGVAALISESIKVDLSVYYTLLSNALVRRPYILNGQDSLDYDGELSEVQAIQNAARADVYGFQIGLDWQISDNWTWRNQFNWQKGEEEDDEGVVGPSRHAAPWFGLSRLQFKYQGLQVETNVQFSGEVSPDDLNFEERGKEYIYVLNASREAYSPGWYTLNLRAMYQISEYWSITAGIENITDQRYRPYSSGLVAPGRNFILGLRASF